MSDRKSVTRDMADRFGVEADAFEATVRATCFSPIKVSKKVDGRWVDEVREATREEFAAFLLVAKQYGLNPLTREIYAYPKKGGGIIPVVSIDGWVNLANSHPQMDGVEFEEVHNDKGNLVAVTCRIYRKDRRMPVTVTERLEECYRDTDPWKQMPHRLLRHKSYVQSTRYAFGFAGIYDEDEAERISLAQAPATPALPSSRIIEGTAVAALTETARPSGETRAQEAGGQVSPPLSTEPPASDPDGVAADELLIELADYLKDAKTPEEIETRYDEFDAEALLQSYPGGVEQARAIKETRLQLLPEKDGTSKLDMLKSLMPDEPVISDPFEPREILGTEDFRQLFRVAIESAVEPGHAEELSKLWKGMRSQHKKVDANILSEVKGRVQDRMDQITGKLPDDTEEPSDLPLAPPPVVTSGAPKTRAEQSAAIDEKVAAFDAMLTEWIRTATTRQELADMWLSHASDRLHSGAAKSKQKDWMDRYSAARSALPNRGQA